MYFLLEQVNFHCHVSLLEGKWMSFSSATFWSDQAGKVAIKLPMSLESSRAMNRSHETPTMNILELNQKTNIRHFPIKKKFWVLDIVIWFLMASS